MQANHPMEMQGLKELPIVCKEDLVNGWDVIYNLSLLGSPTCELCELPMEFTRHVPLIDLIKSMRLEKYGS